MFTLVLVLTVIMISPLLLERVERLVPAPRRGDDEPSEVDGESR
jgi:hypothetical protein